jgi:hypothetical protein
MKPIYEYSSHYKQPEGRIYFKEHSSKWLEKMPDLLTRDCNTLEIGALYGGASVFILDRYSKKTGHHTIIDINTNEYIQHNLKPYEGKYTYLLGESGEHMRTIKKNSMDLVYIDGSHMARNVLEDAVYAYYVTKEYGYIVFDDYGWGQKEEMHCQPKVGIAAFLMAYDRYVRTISVGWQVIAQKIPYQLTESESKSNYINL